MNKVKNYLIWCYKKLCAFLKWYKKLYQGRKWYTKTAIGFLSCIVAFLAYLGMVDMNFLWLFGKSPGFYTIMNPETNEASEIYRRSSYRQILQRKPHTCKIRGCKSRILGSPNCYGRRTLLQAPRN